LLHPDVELRLRSAEIGHGLFATRLIPRGTITWVLCDLEQVFDPAAVERLGPTYRPYLDRYAYATPRGDRVLCCDLGRFMNHSCEPSTLTLPGTELEIAIRDILPGEEVTDDYGTLLLEEDLLCLCGAPSCRGLIRPDDPARHGARWADVVGEALADLTSVPQPLAPYVREGLEGRVALQLGELPRPLRTA
jgi:hypothetical protein